MKTKIVIVDEQDNPIGLKDRGTLKYEDIYRVSALWLTDKTTGDILLAQRKWTKKNDPGKWSAAVSGTIDEGETYRANIVKETEEELGLASVTFKTGPKQYIDDGKHKFFCQWYFGQVDKNKVEIKIQEEELEGVKWLSKQAFLEDLRNNPSNYPPSTHNIIATLGLTQ